jgi:3-oxoacyl-[acyl-carrier protein] reductase
MSLKEKVAVITGGTKGLGRHIAEAFLREGCRVVCASRAPEQEPGLTGDGVLSLQADVRDARSVDELMSVSAKHFGRLDILVANAGVSHPGPIATIPAAKWTEVFDTNLTGTLHCVQAIVPYFENNGGGRVITMSSALASRIAPGAGAYSASKAAIEMFTRVAAIELAGKGITVNCLSPGFVDTGMGARLAANADVWPRYESRLALGRLGRADEIAGAAVFLAGDDSSYVNGHVLEVNGGLNW